jgi:hypothetical protein
MLAREIQVKGRAADLLKDCILLYGRAKKFFDACSTLAKMIKIQRRHSDRIVFRHWQERCATLRIKHARYTIRFWVRAIIRKIREKQAEMEMAAVKRDVMLRFKPKPGPYYRMYLDLWREVFLKVRRERAVVVIHAWMRKRTSVRIDRLRVEYHRRMVEWEKGMVCRRTFMTQSAVLSKWFMNGKARRVQRCLLRRNARRRVATRRVLMGRVAMLNVRSLHTFLAQRWWRWRKCIFLVKREKTRAARTLQRRLRILATGRKITNGVKRKAYMHETLMVLHRLSLRLYLRSARRGANISHFVRVMTRTMDCMEVIQYRGVWERWGEFTREQRILQGLVRVRTTAPLDRAYWTGASDSKAFHRPFIPHGWELPRARTKLLMDDTLLPKVKVWRTWMAAYRNRHRKRRANALVASSEYILEITERFTLMTAKAIVLQRVHRRRVATAALEPRRYHARRTGEADVRLRQRWLHGVLVAAHDISVRRIAARLVVQCAWRCSLARDDVRRRLLYRDAMDIALFADVEELVRRRLIRRYMILWETLYCTRMAVPASLVDVGAGASVGYRTEGPEDEDVGVEQEGWSVTGGTSSDSLAPSSSGVYARPAPSRTLGAKGDRSISYRRPSHAPLPGTEGGRLLTAWDMDPDADPRREKERPGGSPMRDPSAFMGQEFHTAAFQLRQSGVFLVDVTTLHMSTKEVVYVLERAQTVFCRHVNAEMFTLIMRHFGGSKLVLCEGTIPHAAALGLLAVFRNRSRSNPLALHLGGEFKVPYTIVEQIVALVAADLVPLSELSVDSDCFGDLGVCALIGAMRTNRTIETFLVNHDGPEYLPCAVASIRKLSANDR